MIVTSVTYGNPKYIGKTFPSQASAARWLGDPPLPKEGGMHFGAGKHLNTVCILRNKYWKGYMFKNLNVFESDPAHTCLPKIKSGPMDEKDITVVRKQRNAAQQAEFRQGCLQLHGNKCAFCGTTENVEAAHITSQRTHDGRDYEANSIPLCKGVCHPAFDSGRLKWNPDTFKLQLVNFPIEGTFVEPHPSARSNIDEVYWHG